MYHSNFPAKQKIVLILEVELAGSLMLYHLQDGPQLFMEGEGDTCFMGNPYQVIGHGGPLAPGHSYPMHDSFKKRSLFWSSLLGWLRLYRSAFWSEVAFPKCQISISGSRFSLPSPFTFAFTHLPFTDVTFPSFPQTFCNPDYLRVSSLEDPNRYSH